MKAYFQSLALYNRWANDRLYNAISTLSAQEIAAPRIGFFPSLLKTLNHLVVADRIWLARLTHKPDSKITALDQIITADFADLRSERERLDALVIDFVNELSPVRLKDMLIYQTMAGTSYETPIDLVLVHMFNHHTHHRGQAHNMLSATLVSPPSLDMIVFLRDIGGTKS